MGKKDRDSSKPRGRMSAYAYFVQDSRAEHGKNHPNSPVRFAEFSKDCSARWKALEEKGKGVFHEKSMRDKVRYDREMQSYKPPKGEKNKRRRRRKDPDAPKRNLSAFFIFSGENRAAIKSVHPNWSVGDIAKELAVRWRAMTAGEKIPFDKGAAKDKERYIKAMAEYKAKAKPMKRQVKESSSSSSSDSSSDDSSSDDSD
ncbi:high mobility group protein 1 homolog [Strongylocentrotus purpuratus]|uniref:High mobility group protein 1 homolog n=1 Tax=Strongylocentrotus purpuratus TaxID=7668 RepID=HMGH_STRPU|nr:high mobility group protein 1 homolog [Strongylocentrotus purpuratus]P40644.1 RecName: Full=High mobility group protein 1 homolog [Strongylocentrotus purpuratus]AAA91277.1 high mobility group 1 protein [Strongylocentrotus purpuratus]|eukprot:NP_999708.1 high mobility group protein 1 homolog [Strongylocentrotus purpuratus]